MKIVGNELLSSCQDRIHVFIAERLVLKKFIITPPVEVMEWLIQSSQWRGISNRSESHSVLLSSMSHFNHPRYQGKIWRNQLKLNAAATGVIFTIFINRSIIVITCGNKGSSWTATEVCSTMVLREKRRNAEQETFIFPEESLHLHVWGQAIRAERALVPHDVPCSNSEKFLLSGKNVQQQRRDPQQVYKALHLRRRETWNPAER